MRNDVPRLAKLSPPRIPAAVRRGALHERIDAMRSHAVVWVAGWPGAGKTTLVADYLQARSGAFLWLQADAEDGDAGTFCDYLSIAAGQALGAVATGLPRFGAEPSQDVPRFLRRFFRRLYQSRRLTVVIDNFQELPEGAPVRMALAEAVQEIPAGNNLIVISREMPGPEFAQPLAGGAIATIGWEELRLTIDEARQLTGPVECDTDIVSLMHAACDGWAAGLVLLRERFRRTGLVNGSVQGESMELVFGYFAGLLFADESHRVKDALMRLAFLPRMTVADAIAMTGDEAAGELLAGLHRRHLFTTQRFQPELTFEFHALLRQFLQARARALLPRDEYVEVCRHAAARLQGTDDASGALALYAEIGDLDAIETLLLRVAPRWLKQGRVRTLREAIELLPDGRVTESASLSYFAGMAEMSVDQKKARQSLTSAFHGFEAAGSFEGQVRAAGGVVETYFGNYSEFGSIGQWCDRLVGLVESHALTELPDDVRLDALGGFLIAGVYGRPGHPGLRRVAIDVRDALLCAEVSDEQRLRIGTWFITYCAACVRMELGRSVAPMLDTIASTEAVGSIARMWWSIRRGYFYYVDGDLDGAYRCLSLGYELSREQGIRQADGLIAMWSMLVHTQSERPELRPLLIPDPRRTILPGRVADMVYLEAIEFAARCYSNPDDPALPRLGKVVVDLSDRAQLLWIRVAYRVPLALALAHAGRAEEAEAYADEVVSLVSHTCFDTYVREVECIRAYAALRTGRQAAGQAALARWIKAFSDDAAYPCCRWYKWPYLTLLETAISSGIETDGARRLLRKYWPHHPMAMNDAGPPVHVRLLGKFEIAVNGCRLDLGRRPPGRLLDVLQLLALRGRPWVATAELTDLLWPDSDGDRSNQALKVAIHRLRRLLGASDAVEVSGGQLRLSPVWVKTDVAMLDATVDECLVQAAREGERWLERAYGMLLEYPGAVLPGSERPWVVADRIRVERKIRHLARAVIDRTIAEGRPDSVSVLVERLADRGISGLADTRAGASGGMEARLQPVPAYRVSEL